MAQRSTSRRRSRNAVPGFGWLTEKKVTYRRSKPGAGRGVRGSEARAEAKRKKDAEKQERDWQNELQSDYAYQMGSKDKRAGRRPLKAAQVTLESAKKALGVQKATSLAQRSYTSGYRQNPERPFKEPIRSYRGAAIEHIANVGYRITIPARVARDGQTITIDVYSLPEAKDRIDREFGAKRNPEGDMRSSTEYRLGYNLGQTDKNTAALPKTSGELQAVFTANFASAPLANIAWFEDGYQTGYGSAAANPGMTLTREMAWAASTDAGNRSMRAGGRTKWSQQDFNAAAREFKRLWPEKRNPAKKGNQELEGGDGSPEYEQAARTAELFHGRPVQETLTVEEEVKTHRWYVSLGPLIKLKIRPLTSRQIVPLKFNTSEKDTVHLFTSPDGRQFYLRGGDQELDVAALGMGPKTKWYRDLMIIGEAREITYRDRKKFHKFSLTDYFHKLGEVTNEKPSLIYNSLAQKLEIVGGQYEIEMNDLVEGMSPGIVN